MIDLKDQLVEEAVRLETIEDSQTAREILGAELMDLVTPCPSQVNRDFWTTYAHSLRSMLFSDFEIKFLACVADFFVTFWTKIVLSDNIAMLWTYRESRCNRDVWQLIILQNFVDKIFTSIRIGDSLPHIQM